MSAFDRLFEQKLQAAREQGLFDETRRGGVIDSGDDTWVPEDERMAMWLLKRSGYAPAWIEEDSGLRAKLVEMRKFLAHALSVYRRSRAQAADAAGRIAADDAWRAACLRFETAVAEFNREIFLFNLRAPALNLHRMPVRASEEYAALGVQPPASR
jgi:Domain of unknown function (DUF1992)